MDMTISTKIYSSRSLFDRFENPRKQSSGKKHDYRIFVTNGWSVVTTQQRVQLRFDSRNVRIDAFQLSPSPKKGNSQQYKYGNEIWRLPT